jgi:hypothetical protein
VDAHALRSLTPSARGSIKRSLEAWKPEQVAVALGLNRQYSRSRHSSLEAPLSLVVGTSEGKLYTRAAPTWPGISNELAGFLSRGIWNRIIMRRMRAVCVMEPLKSVELHPAGLRR